MERRMAILGFELEEIVRLLALLEENRLDEILIEEEGRYLRIRGPRRSKPARPVFPSEVRPAGASAPPRPAISAPLSADRSGNGSAPLPTDHVALVSPMVGVFYRAGKPGDPPFIGIGQPIELNQTIGV